MQGFSKKIQSNFSVDHRIKEKEVAVNEPYFLSNDDYLISGKSDVLEIPVTNLLFFLKKPTFFIPFPTPGHMKLGGLSKLTYMLTKTWDFIMDHTTLVILFHDFTFNSKKSIQYLEDFINKCSQDTNINFVTLSELYKNYYE